MNWWTWREVANAAAQVAVEVERAGVKPGDRVAQVSENRHEWIITDLALHLVGAVHVPMHVTLAGEQIAAQIDDCDAKLVFASSMELYAKFASLLSDKVSIRLHDAPVHHTTAPPEASSPAPRILHPDPSSLATILYTSGTTGRPRGVMLSHSNLATNASATADAFGGGPEQTRLCVLPLSHIYARTCDLYTWVYRGSRLVFAESREMLARDLQLARPTALNAVPYLYQKIAEKLRALPNDKQSAALRHYFGGQIETLSCGGAALAPDVERWFSDLGLPILCGYGLTESSPVISASTPTRHRIGSVGPPLPNVEVRIAADGEILARGPSIMIGYANDAAASNEIIRDGWLHTGDLGELDADRFLFIRGRKKELIVLSTGKKVLPTRVETLLAASPHIEQAAVYGDGRCALVALIVPAAGGLAHETCAREIGRLLASAAREEQVRNFAILDRPFSIERGELTPKLSLCRTVIARNFAAELESIRM